MWLPSAEVSRPEELHLRPLAELCMRLSPHTAPIRQTRHSSLNGLSVAFIASSCFQLSREGNHLIRSLCSSPITAPSSLLRIGPPQCSASVLSPHGCRHLCFSLDSGATGSRSSAREPVSASRPLYAGRRLPSHQAPGRLVPGDGVTPGFDDGPLANDASSKGSLSFVSPTHTCSRYFLELFLQRSPPRLLTAAAWSGLRPAPESRSRGANPHLPHSLSTRSVRSR